MSPRWSILLSAVVPLVVLCLLGVTRADADLWGHLAFGRDIVRAGAVHASDPYSFTTDQAWVNHEWLAEVLMWLSYEAGGAPGLVALKLLLALVAGACLLAAWRPFALPPMRRDVLLFAVSLAAWPQFITARPQAFSMALFAVLLGILLRVGTSPRWALAIPPLFALWVNLHGGWLVGAGVLALFVAAALVDARVTRRQHAVLLAASALAALATICNPYGTAMLSFLGDTVRPARAEIVEWRPLVHMPPIALALWTLPAALALAAALRGMRRVPLASWLIVGALAVGSLTVGRLLGFFALAVGMLVAPWALTPAARGTQPRSAPAVSAAPVRDLRARVTGAARAMACAAALLGAAVALVGRRIPIDGPLFPEPESVAFARAHALRGRMFTWFDYGQYALWHLGPGVLVSMDGRRETVYTPAMRALHWLVYENDPAAVDALARLAPDYVWVPTALPVLPRLQRAGWHVAFAGPRSTMLSRRPFGPPVRCAVTPPVPRAFPGP